MRPRDLRARYVKWRASVACRFTGRASFAGRCLLFFHSGSLFCTLLVLFLAHAARVGVLSEFLLSVSLALRDDIFWPSVVVFGFLLACCLTRLCPSFTSKRKLWLVMVVAISFFADTESDIVLGGGTWLSIVLFWFSSTILRFWLFLQNIGLQLLRGVSQRYLPQLQLEEQLAALVMAWWLLRTVYIVTNSRLERWFNRQLLQRGLRFALEHPFYAELEQGFGSRLSSRLKNFRLRPPMMRSRSWSGSSHSVFGLLGGQVDEEKIQSLQQKHQALVTARHEAWKDEVASTDMVYEVLELEVRRTHILEDTWRIMLDSAVSELLAPDMTVSFVEEEGIDGGGLTRDFFDAVGMALLEGAGDVGNRKAVSSSLLVGAPDGSLVPRPLVSDKRDAGADTLFDEEKYQPFLALGRFIAFAVLHKQPLPLSFSSVVCKHFLCTAVDMDDVRRLDPDFYHERLEQVLKDGGLEETVAALGEPLTFVSAPTELRPAPEELKPGGSSLSVTEENLTEYVELLCEAYLCGSMRRELQCLLQGFWDLLPVELLVQCEISARELSVLISGVASLDVEDWRKHSDVGSTLLEAGGDVGGRLQRWFWQLVEEMGKEQRCVLLHFTTGSSRLPPGGFAALRPQFTLTADLDSGSAEHLPHAHTCANQLVLHSYCSKSKMRAKLLMAISAKDFRLP
ncbi:unnamed protein product [Polarella glacialis]|uniref:HECT-type E3 ubiquitin transferase n=1 Tax=Polarella glacialis TaxID=89957 RepID=A0A813LU61_POLGL|nr:unnamed protein product [Polarella glacialis]